ncbi:MAG: aminopeptidase P family protein [Marinilabiliales bacterium]|nr:MAG: aminopeptidase P family protein [Marinilabiliales bacterium]
MFKPDVYRQRRNRLAKDTGKGLVLLPGNEDASMNYRANTYHFRQDSSFLYFFGIDQQGLAGLIDLDENVHMLFGDDAGIDDIIWMGPRPSIRSLGEKSGTDKAMPYKELGKILKQAVDSNREIHYLPPYREERILRLESWLGIHHSEVQQRASRALIKAVVSQRSIKSDEEIAEIEKAVDIACEMHTAAMKMAMPGVYEREIAGRVEGISLSHGNPVSFPVILSVQGQTLHNHYHGNILKKGQIMVTDAGSETSMRYSSDITRSVPVGGKFLPQQKDVYQIVLAALQSSVDSIKPGVPYRDIHLKSAGIIARGLIDLGLMKGDPEEAVHQGAHALFFPHGLGHMLGLDAHDMEDLGEDNVGYDDEVKRSGQFGLAFLRLGRRLQKGFVLTSEPGIYFIPALIDKWRSEGKFKNFIDYGKVEQWKNFGGIRIEDDILVTAEGCRVLGIPIPKTVAEIEHTMQQPVGS